jgi:hypothetical protein
MVLEESEQERDAFVFLRGNHMTRGEKVKPGFLTALSRGKSELNYLPGKRRLALAQAIVSKENPLTSRVIVNWIWQQHFGQGVDQANAQANRAIPNVPASIHGKCRLSEDRSRERVDVADAETKT